jgi:hypothetical protein
MVAKSSETHKHVVINGHELQAHSSPFWNIIFRGKQFNVVPVVHQQTIHVKWNGNQSCELRRCFDGSRRWVIVARSLPYNFYPISFIFRGTYILESHTMWEGIVWKLCKNYKRLIFLNYNLRDRPSK